MNFLEKYIGIPCGILDFLRPCNMKQDELTKRIIGCAMNVHRILKSGFQEKVYQSALGVEFFNSNISFIAEKELTVYYKQVIVGSRRVDFFIEDQIMLEIKAITVLEDLQIAQIMNYCQAYNLPFALLINFGAKSLEFKRIYNIHHPDNLEYKNKKPI